MPSKSRAQHNFMAMIAHGVKPRGGKGPSKAVAREFLAADKKDKAYKKRSRVKKTIAGGY
jgi:ribosomal protein S7